MNVKLFFVTSTAALLSTIIIACKPPNTEPQDDASGVPPPLYKWWENVQLGAYSIDTQFLEIYNAGGRKAGTYTRPDTSSNVWIRQ